MMITIMITTMIIILMVMFALEQAMKTQGGSRGIALIFL